MMIPLQSICTDVNDPTEALVNFEFIAAVTCTYTDAAGFFVVGMIVYGAVGLSIYIRTGSAIIPSILLLLTGGIVMTQVVAPVVAIATVLILSIGGGVLGLLYYRYAR